MKKLIGTVAVAALLATAAFAEGLSFGSWGRALWVVGNSAATKDGKVSGDNVVTSWLGQSWGAPGPRTALAVNGSSDNIGFTLDFHANGGGLGVGDNALVWAKPVDMVKVTIAAKNDQNTLRSDAAFGMWNYRRIGPVAAFDEEGWIFPSTFTNGKNVSIEVTPIEGLLVGYGFACWGADTDWAGANRKSNAGKDNEAGYSSGNWNKTAVDEDKDSFASQIGRTSALAASYTIANIGTVKLGFEAKGKGYDKNGGINGERKDKFQIDAAFELTMLEKVYVALGTRIPLGGTFSQYADVYGDGKLYVANAEATYVNLYSRLSLIDNLKINILAGLKLNSADYKKDSFKASGAFGFRFGVEAEYTLSNGIGFFGEVQYANGIWMVSNSADNNDSLGFALGAQKGFSNGVIGVAFEGATNAYGRNVLKNVDDFAWEVPVKIEYWF